jgi:hypothetical protein
MFERRSPTDSWIRVIPSGCSTVKLRQTVHKNLTMGSVKEVAASRKRTHHQRQYGDEGTPEQRDGTGAYGARVRHFIPLHSSSSINVGTGSPQGTTVDDEVGKEYAISYACSNTLRLLRAADLPLQDLEHVFTEYLSLMGVVESESDAGQEHMAESDFEVRRDYKIISRSSDLKEGKDDDDRNTSHGRAHANQSAYHRLSGNIKRKSTYTSHAERKNKEQPGRYERTRARVAFMHPLPSWWRRSGKLTISTLVQEAESSKPHEAGTNSDGPDTRTRGTRHRAGVGDHNRDTRALIVSARVGENADAMLRMLSDMSSAKRRMDKARMFLDLARSVREDPALAVILQDMALSSHAHWAEKVVCIDTLVAADKEDAQHALLGILHLCDTQARRPARAGTDDSTEQETEGDDAPQAHGPRARRAKHPQRSWRHCSQGLEARVLNALAGVKRPSESFLKAFYRRATRSRAALFSLAKLLRHPQEHVQDQERQEQHHQEYGSSGHGRGRGQASAVTLSISRIHKHFDGLRKKRPQSQETYTARGYDTDVSGKMTHVHHDMAGVHDDEGGKQERRLHATMHDAPSDANDDRYTETSDSEKLGIHDYIRALLIIHGGARPEQIHTLLKEADKDEKIMIYRDLESANIDVTRPHTTKLLFDAVKTETNQDVRSAGLDSLVRLDQKGHVLEDVLQLVEVDPSLGSKQVSMYFDMMMINNAVSEDTSARIRALPSFQVIICVCVYIYIYMYTCVYV